MERCRIGFKQQVKSDSIVLQAKGQDAFTTKNINNYILLSNHDLYDSDRRMFVLDVQTHYKGNREYWSNIYNNCFNNDVGNALYSYFYEIDTNNYQPQDYPLTDNKLNSISKRLDFVYQYIKEEHILTNKDLKSKLSDLYDEFSFWCARSQKKACQKTDFVSKLKEIQIYHKKSNGYLVYNVKLDVLKEIAAQQHWMTELDEYSEGSNDEDDKEEPPSQKAMTVDECNKYEEMKLKYEELEAENKNVYKKLLKTNEQIVILVQMAMKSINLDTIKQDLEQHKKQEIKNKNEIKKHTNIKSIAEFVESIELF